MPKLSDMPAAVNVYYLGIDPGSSSGGAGIVFANGQPLVCDFKIECIKFEKATEHEISEWFADKVQYIASVGGELKAALERVHSMPDQSAQSGFKFGWSYGFLRGMLAAHRIPYQEPTPQIWQRKLQCLTGGNKNISKAKAHELWPLYTKQLTHATSDAMLIAEFLRRLDQGKF